MKANNRHPEITLSETETEKFLHRKNRRGFLAGGVAALAAVGGYEWLTHASEKDDVPWPQRDVLDFNGRLAHAYLSNGRLMRTFKPSDVRYLKPNGAFGLKDPVEDWSLTVDTGTGPPLKLGLQDIRALPAVDMITRFCCIEGWDTVAHWTGARFSDFTRKYFTPGRRIPDYVSMNTPDEEYYVGLDAKSALHPQTLLAYAKDGVPLTAEHGAPLRLVIPVKYGIKNIKRIGTIRYTDRRPADYWAEDGYDWFAGL
jgi:hypothetical protein